jgi:hypothetical protein
VAEDNAYEALMKNGPTDVAPRLLSRRLDEKLGVYIIALQKLGPSLGDIEGAQLRGDNAKILVIATRLVLPFFLHIRLC